MPRAGRRVGGKTRITEPPEALALSLNPMMPRITAGPVTLAQAEIIPSGK